MASIIRIKRSETSGNPGTLGAGELAYSALTDNGSNGGDRLYVGIGTETSGNAANHYVIGGKFFTDRLDHTAGTLTASSAIVVDSNSKIDILNVDNLTLDGNTLSSTSANGDIILAPNGTGTVSINSQYSLPTADGTNGQFLKTDGSGNLTFAAVPSGSFDLAGDSGTDTFNTGETLTFTGGTAIDTTITDNTVTIAFNGNSVALTGTPTAPTATSGDNSTQIATTAYVDVAVGSMTAGLDVKDSVRAATTANITLSGTQTIDDVALIAGDRVLVKNQTTLADNGIYVVSSGAWSRSLDADADDEVTPGLFTFVEEGTTLANTGWILSTNGAITVGTTDLTFAKFSSQGEILAGTGLDKTGNTLSIDTAYTGQTSITTLGTIATGTWNADVIGSAYGGTGFSTYAQGDLVVASAANTLSKLALGQSGKILQSNGTDLVYGDIDGGTY